MSKHVKNHDNLFNIKSLMQQASKHFDVVIFGGSYIGLTLALFLSNLNLKIAIIEKTPKPAKNPNEPSRLLAIAKSSTDAYTKYLKNSLFQDQTSPITFIRVLEQNSSAYLDFNPSELGLNQFGVMIEEHVLYERLYQQVAASLNITLFHSLDLLDLETKQEATYMHFHNDEKLSASLVIACDGKHSWLRKYFGIGVQKFNYRQSAIVCDIKHQHNHEGAAIEKFLPEGPFAILPKAGGYSSAIVWTCPSRHSEALSNLDQDLLEEVILSKFGNHLGNTKVISKIKMFPLSLTSAKTYIDHRFALAGDAAHSIHPLAGQGLNLGIRDVLALTKLIQDNMKLGLDIGSRSMLKEYERIRKVDNNIMIEATHHLNLLFSNNILPIKLARSLGLKIINKSPSMRKFFMKYAMGI